MLACAFQYTAGFSGPSAVHLVTPLGADPNQPYIACIACPVDVQATSNHHHGNCFFGLLLKIL